MSTKPKKADRIGERSLEVRAPDPVQVEASISKMLNWMLINRCTFETKLESFDMTSLTFLINIWKVNDAFCG